jgi:hypothetical protein
VRSCAEGAVAALVLVASIGLAAPPAPAAGAGAGSPPSRFVIAGNGRLALENSHGGARCDVRFRQGDGTYDPGAVARIRAVLGGPVALRLIELLSRVQETTGRTPLVLVSGYRSPEYNAELRQKGRAAAAASLHTEGLAADVAFPKKTLRPLWLRMRALDCCGTGLYAAEGFLHLDVGPARFWEAATSRVSENLSADNARVFARTEFDRYAAGETIVVTVHSLTAPPIRLGRAARLVPAKGKPVPLAVEGGLPERDGCLEADATGASVRVAGATAGARGPIEIPVCAPRAGRTPAVVVTNPVEVR